MPIHNSELADGFNMLADLLEIEGANAFRIRAYRNAARTIENYSQEFTALVEEETDLTSIQGIGKDLAEKIKQFIHTGRFEALEKLRSSLPDGITDLLKIQGLGPKRVKTLYQDLGIGDLAGLGKAAREGKISALPGLGSKMEKQILEAVEKKQNTEQRYRRASVEKHARSYLEHLQTCAGVKKLSLAGSYRRGRETVGDLDILAVATAKSPIMQTFVDYDEVTKVLAQGKTKSSVFLRNGLQVDLRVVSDKSFGAALHYFTGSQAHNIAIRKRAQQQGLKSNEYGLFKGDKVLAGKTEEEIFKLLKLDYIPPEIREDRGEIEAAESESLPSLIEQKQIRGDLHMHTRASDGSNTIEEMAAAAKERGYEYIAITDHSKRLTVANGLDEDRLLRQIEDIDSVNESLKGITVLKGIECDILEDGTMDLSNDVLKRLDLVIGSVHSKFNLSREKQTERILRAMDNPYFSFMAHPTGRKILERDPYEVDMTAIIRHARDRGCFLELNANPVRLDMHETHCRAAMEAGVPVVINTDAHRTEDFELMSFGISQARRGWLENKHVINTCSLKTLRKKLSSVRLD